MTAIAADSVAVKKPATTPMTTMTTAARAQIDVLSCFKNPMIENLSPFG